MNKFFPNPSAKMNSALVFTADVISLSQSGRVEALAFRRRLQHARRRLSLWDGRLPARRAYRIRDPFASGVDNEVSPPSPEWRGGDESARPDPGHLCAAGGEHHERACGQRPRAPVRVDSAAGDHQPTAAVVDGAP